MTDILVRRPPSPHRTPSRPRKNKLSSETSENVIKSKLREIMKASDLDTITSKKIRKQLESELGQSFEQQKSFIDQEILVVLGQMDPASRILDYLYLGSEWNASNLEELKANQITHILNVTREIDNFFPADFKYKNIRVYDEEATDLLRYLNHTYTFIKDAKDSGGKVLVHCKMGISRSATCTIAFVMKEYDKDLASTLKYAKDRRSIVKPNKAFLKQLEVYEGILGAMSFKRIYGQSCKLYRSKSESSLVPKAIVKSRSKNESLNIDDGNRDEVDGGSTSASTEVASNRALRSHPNPDNPSQRRRASKSDSSRRPKSWSPNDKVAHFLLDQADKLSKSATADNVLDDCNCFDQLTTTTTVSQGGGGDSNECETTSVASGLAPAVNSPVNSLGNYNPNCECDMELELPDVPSEPVSVAKTVDDDQETDMIVQSLSHFPIQLRSISLLDGFSSASNSSGSSAPTTPIFSLKRRSSIDTAVTSRRPPTPPPMPTSRNPSLVSSASNEADILSVKTLANMFDYKVVSTLPLRPCATKLEDNKLFQKAAKELGNL